MLFGLRIPAFLGAILGWLVCANALGAETARVAVATNFRDAAQDVAAAFAKVSDYEIALIYGSTGKLYAQIVNGAPFDLFLAADQARPADLGKSGLGVADTQATYAIGRLALVSKRSDLGPDLAEAIWAAQVTTLAIANPRLAPYGLAATQTLEAMRPRASWPRIVMGENVGQAFALVARGGADAGLIARSSLSQPAGPANVFATVIEVPAAFHAPIRQDVILLENGRTSPAAVAFLAFLTGPEARAIIAEHGYGEGVPMDPASPEHPREDGG